MADVRRTVEILFLGNDSVSKTVRDISGTLGQFDTMAQSVAQPLAAVGDAILGLDAALAALAVGGMALAISKSSEFETSFKEISTLLDASSQDIKVFRDDVLDYASGSVKSIDDINGAVYSAISAGIDYRTVLGTLTEAEKLSIAGKAGLKDTTLLLASTLNAYGESTDQASRYSNAFFNTVKLGQTTLPELATALSKVTGIAASANIPIEDLTAAVAALTVAGMPTTEAITGLKQVISSILAPGAEAKKLFGELGIEYGKNAIEAKGLDGVLAQIQAKTHGNAEAMKVLLGGVEGLNAGLILAADRSGKYAAALETMRSSQDVVTAAFEKMNDSVKASNQILANNVDILLIQVGDRMLEGYKDVAGGITDIFRAMQEAVASGAFDDLFTLIDQFGADLTKFLSDIARALPAAFDQVNFDDLIDALQDLGREFGMIFDDIDLTTPEGLADAIQGAVDTLESLVRVTQGMVRYFEPLWDSITEGIGQFNELGESEKLAAGEMLGVAELVAKAGTQIGLALVAIGKSGADIEAVFGTIAGAVRTIWNLLHTDFDIVATIIAAAVNQALAAADAFLTLSEKIMNALGIEPSRQFDAMKKAIDGMHDSARRLRDAAFDTMIEDFGETAAAAADTWNALNGRIDQTPRSAGAAKEAITSLIAEIEGAPSEFTLTPEVDLTAVQEVASIIGRELPDVMDIGITVDEAGNIQKAGEKLDAAIPKQKEEFVVVTLDDGSVMLTNREIDTQVPKEGTLSVMTSLDKQSLEKAKKEINDEFKAQAEVLKTQIEWKAKVDIAEVEAATEVFKTSMDSVNLGIGETTKLMETAFENMTSSSFNARWEAQQTLDMEQEFRRQEFDLQKLLIEQQTQLIEAKRRAIEQGEGLIKISTDGLEPALETVLYEIVKKIQMRANEEASEFLLGLS